MNEIERARSALKHLDAGCSREEWVRIGMSVKAAGLLFDDFHSWSQNADNYKGEKDCRNVWESFKKSGAVTPATLFGMAFAAGWTNSRKLNANLKSTLAKFKNKTQKSINEVANQTAIEIWERCVPATGIEQYLSRKQGKPDRLRVYPAEALPYFICGQNIAGYLVVPCLSNGLLQTLQFISPIKNEKLNLPGASFNDGFFVVGEISDQIYICEGLGQAWAVNKAMGAAAIVCFGSCRMERVAKVLREKYPQAHLVVVSDRGKEAQASEIASIVGGQWIEMPQNKSQNYDANDYMQESGVNALIGLLESTKMTKTNGNILRNESFLVTKLPQSNARDGTINTRPLTELGNSQRLLDSYAGVLKYISDAQAWITWKDSSWQWDDGSGVRSLAAQLPKSIYAEGIEHLKDGEYFAKWARKSQEQRIINSSVSMLSDFEQMRLLLKYIDADPFTVGFNNARQVIDLRDGTPRTAKPSDYITRSLGVEMLGDASKAVRWITFLEQIFDGDKEIIDWMQRFCGYLLTGSTKEQIFLFCFGHGANGKSVFSELLKLIMGNYSRAIASETLSETKRQAGGATPDLAVLIGARLVLCNETEDNAALAESLVKGLVSGDSMAVRRLYAEPIEFKPNCKLVITGNHKPIVRGNDNGIWRRVRLVPFNRTFLPEERDPDLLVKLGGEMAHILAWMVDGCINWQKNGLADTPAAIRIATDSYQSDQDLIGTWLSECTSLNVNSEALTGELYANYKAWCTDNGLRPTSAAVLGRRLGERGYKVRQSNGKRFWLGLSLTDLRRFRNDYASKKGGC